MGAHISDIDIVPRVRVRGDTEYARVVREAAPTAREVECLRAGAIAALCEVYGLLTGEREPTDPGDRAESMLVDMISVITDHRVDAALKGDDAS